MKDRTMTVPDAETPGPSSGLMAQSTRALLQAPILPALLRLSAPTIVVMVVQAAINALEMFFVGWLGTEALAGVSLVFPMIMLMQTMSAGGMGGGVASAIARALGAGRREDANALVVHALVIALVMSVMFTTGALLGGPALYRAMGAMGGTLDAAVTYSNVVFAGAAAAWTLNILASVIRGIGNMMLPAMVVIAGGPLLVALSPALIFGWGPFPQLGVAGAGIAIVLYYSFGTVVLLGYLLAGRGLVKLSLPGIRLRYTFFWEILRVGALGSVNTIQTNLTALLLTGLVGPFGTTALAGYGIGMRLEYIQIPLVFGFGSALVTMVGTNIGAGRLARAEQVAFVGAGLAVAITGSIGLIAAIFPWLWLGLFTDEADVLTTGAVYLRIVGPTYGFFVLGLALYFASQGAGQLLWPFLASLARLLIAAIGGWLAIHWLGGGLSGLFSVIALSFVVFGVTMAIAIKAGAWRLPARRR